MPQTANNFGTHTDIALINLVKQHPLLYDTKDSNYTNANAREVVWTQISEQLKRPSIACKTRWINIRDMMRRKVRTRAQNKHKRNYTYKYEKELSFIIPIFLQTIENPSEADQTDETSMYFSEDDGHDQSNIDVIIEPECQDDEYDSDNQDCKEILFKSLKSLGSPDGNATPLPSSSSKMKRPRFEVLNTSDPLDVFLMTVGGTLRKLSPYYLSQAKSKIFQIVSDYELQHIIDSGGQPTSLGAQEKNALEHDE